MNKVLIIGAGGVSNVVVHKCAAVPEVFGEIVLASRTKSKCDKIAADVKKRLNREVITEALDADKVEETVALINKHQPKLVINVALPYQDLAIMDACLETGVDYLDTANYEPKDEAKFEYKWQWAYQDKYKEAGLMALLGSGFDPGVTNMFCAYAQKHLFDEIHNIDIVDCNGGDHGQAFATNFNPEINIREITANGRYWEQGEWKTTEPLSVKQDFNFPGVGVRKMYLMYHEEMESLCQNIKGLNRIRFWMTFGEEYLTHLRVIQNLGLDRIDEVDYKGQKVVPLEFLKQLLPDPGSLAENYTGKTSIGCVIEGIKDGKKIRKFIYNNCDHAETFKEVGSQAVSYTTGVPAMIGAKMILTGKWKQAGVYNMEQLDPDAFMEDLKTYGLPWHVEEWSSSVE
ncbi:saccharopine dehydrogenase family protein [Carboxylicivirga marina]|uniref:Saccharopine dehydrogenase family protein n=1 Tax=Carboxylicivirga marina TaxID=2800988 RepID=A0ABS1HKB2_9BACT|nr:saccharopine dehydrogenase family protein [Carboxylicivirga marina]MBK3518081.1 saccharopine dehydrogenase family protein [Carboxylicivirga marina]